MKVSAPILFLLLATSSVNAMGLTDRAAKVFERACLSKQVLALGNGSEVGDGAVAVLHAGNIFARDEANGKTKGLVGQPTYNLGRSKKTGVFKCYIASKDLSAGDVTKRFNRLKRIAGQGSKPSYVGPAKFDDDTNRYIEGKRAEFESEGRKLLLELFFFQSDKGPVGALYLTLEHKVSQ
ncbi:MAG: hypothetical protein COB16_18495 [Rhodobacteraceae bacterium]|nr:MAG: hypothetical protein COB16_18495 [Paracoccaceae bacterium]